MSSKIFIVFLFVLTVLTRFYKLDWGNGFFFHPDENNMASAISSLKTDDLNPHFFAYGQFPLYLVFYTQNLVHFLTQKPVSSISFEEAIFGLRFYSAFFSCLSIYIFWKISKVLFNQKKHQYLLVLLLIFSPGLIQLSHFGTTESILIFIFSFILLYSINFIKTEKISFKQLFLLALISGIGVASKITAIIFTAPVLIIFLFLFFKKNNKIYILKRAIFFLVLTVFFICLFSPYNFISFADFVSTMNYETGVANGTIDVFYTRQFFHTVPYFFQFQKVFPFALGLPVFILALFGFFTHKYKKESFILVISAFIYFAYCGQLYVKWFRFVSPVFPIFTVFAVYFISQIKNKYVFYVLSFLSLIPGVLFFNQIYANLDIRYTADNWIRKNISYGQHILSEDKNVISIPFNSDNFSITNFNFYDLDENKSLVKQLPFELYLADYILVPSRRVYKNHPASKYPIVSSYYQNLFDGSLGFEKVVSFSANDSLFLNSNNAEETFSVFDHPQILIYKKSKNLTVDQYKQILKI